MYLIISDMHISSGNKNNRIDYSNEVTYAINKVVEICNRYRGQGYKTVALFLGDIHDLSYRDSDSALMAYNSFREFTKGFSKVFSVVGNHEFTYYKNNPFWHSLKDLNSKRVLEKSKRGNWFAKGKENYINVVDSIQDGEVEFIFNHYGTGIQRPDSDKFSIGLFHQDIYFREILDEAKARGLLIFEKDEETMKKRYGYIYLSENSPLKGYNYCTFGHNHSLYGEWKDDYGCTLNYLASLGRTNHREVQDSFLERNVPAVIVENGKLLCIQDNKFNLMKRSDCVNEESVNKQSKLRDIQKERKEIVTLSVCNENPVDAVRQTFNNPSVDRILDSILLNENDAFLMDFKERLNNIIIK